MRQRERQGTKNRPQGAQSKEAMRKVKSQERQGGWKEMGLGGGEEKKEEEGRKCLLITSTRETQQL